MLEKDFHLAQEAVAHQGDTVRALKAAVKDGKAEKVGTLCIKREAGWTVIVHAGAVPPACGTAGEGQALHRPQ